MFVSQIVCGSKANAFLHGESPRFFQCNGTFEVCVCKYAARTVRFQINNSRILSG